MRNAILDQADYPEDERNCYRTGIAAGSELVDGPAPLVGDPLTVTCRGLKLIIQVGSIGLTSSFLLASPPAAAQPNMAGFNPAQCDPPQKQEIFVAIGRTVLAIPSRPPWLLQLAPLSKREPGLIPVDQSQHSGCYANPIQVFRVQTHKVHQTTAATRYTEAAKFAASLS
jgi:hypothetical protein